MSVPTKGEVWSAVRRIRAADAKEEDVALLVAASASPDLWAAIQAWCAALRPGGQDMSNQWMTRARAALATAIAATEPSREVKMAGRTRHAGVLALAWRQLFTHIGGARMAEPLRAVYDDGALLYASVDSLYDPRTGSPLQWRNGLPQRHAAAAPQSARSIAIAELRGMTIVSCLVQQTGRLRGEVDEEENSHIREQLTSLVKDLEQLWRRLGHELLPDLSAAFIPAAQDGLFKVAKSDGGRGKKREREEDSLTNGSRKKPNTAQHGAAEYD